MSRHQLYVIAEGHQAELEKELAWAGVRAKLVSERLIESFDSDFEPAWAQAVWHDVETLPIESIGDAKRKLCEISRVWQYFGDRFFRRGALIAEGLNLAKGHGEVQFPRALSRSAPVFTLAEPGVILYSQRISRPTADGVLLFNENRQVPPSRAYLKLWEALTLLGHWPKAGDQVIDLGSSPGSWTWALAELGAHVTSIDRSRLDDRVSAYGNVEFRTGDAFSVEPYVLDWLFSDVICYPEKLYEYSERWLASGKCENFVCTLKFTGEPDPAIIDRFRKLPMSRVIHLHHNKNEVTWIRHPSLARR